MAANKEGKQVDFAITNNVGILSDLNTTTNSDGNNIITLGNAQTVQPFGNLLQVVEMKGSDIPEAINQQYGAAHYYLQIAGLKYKYTPTTDSTYQYKVVSATTNKGEQLGNNQTYRVVFNSFLFGGGDEFSAFTKGKWLIL